jgi:hypothetical protein
MVWYQTAKDTCIYPLPKNASTSIRSVLAYQAQNDEITAEAAAKLPVRVVFLRNPIERIQSAFGQFYALQLNGNTYFELVPKGVISAFGARLKGQKGYNEYVFEVEQKAKYLTDTVIEIDKQPTIEAAAAEFNQKDYNGFIDYILSGADNEHWASQVEQVTHHGEYLPTHTYKMEDISSIWPQHFIGLIPVLNSHTKITVNPYRQDELEQKYAVDIDVWSSL